MSDADCLSIHPSGVADLETHDGFKVRFYLGGRSETIANPLVGAVALECFPEGIEFRNVSIIMMSNMRHIEPGPLQMPPGNSLDPGKRFGRHRTPF